LIISVESLKKTFKIVKRNEGVKAAVKTFFSKEYETITAINNISFSISEGEIVGYVGPNGAGKSTTIKIMCGILVPDNGNCVVNGYIPWKDRTKYVKEIGVVFGQRSQLWWDLPVVDSFSIIKNIYKVPENDYKINTKKLIDLLDLEQIVKTPVRQLSLGQRMRCELAASLIHMPKVLFLDEPTIGLDAVSKITVRNIIKQINKENGVTVILTTHDMNDIEALTNRLLLIGKGELLFDDTLEKLKNRYNPQKIITVKATDDINAQINGLTLNEKNENQYVFSLNPELLSLPEAINFLNTRLKITDMTVSEENTDSIIVKAYKEFSI